MKWFISCLVIITICLTVLLTQILSVTIIAVDESLTEKHLNNLLIIYNIDTEGIIDK